MLVNNHKWDRLSCEFACRASPHAARAADDVMIRKAGDLPFHFQIQRAIKRKPFRISSVEGHFWEFAPKSSLHPPLNESLSDSPPSIPRGLQHRLRTSLLDFALLAAVAEIDDQSDHQPNHQPNPGSSTQAVH